MRREAAKRCTPNPADISRQSTTFYTSTNCRLRHHVAQPAVCTGLGDQAASLLAEGPVARPVCDGALTGAVVHGAAGGALFQAAAAKGTATALLQPPQQRLELGCLREQGCVLLDRKSYLPGAACQYVANTLPERHRIPSVTEVHM